MHRNSGAWYKLDVPGDFFGDLWRLSTSSASAFGRAPGRSLDMAAWSPTCTHLELPQHDFWHFDGSFCGFMSILLISVMFCRGRQIRPKWVVPCCQQSLTSQGSWWLAYPRCSLRQGPGQHAIRQSGNPAIIRRQRFLCFARSWEFGDVLIRLGFSIFTWKRCQMCTFPRVSMKALGLRANGWRYDASPARCKASWEFVLSVEKFWSSITMR